MKNDRLLIVPSVTGSALCTWPALIEPSIDFPRWILLVVVALITGLSTILSVGRWVRYAVASLAGVFVGALTGSILFPSDDGIAQSFALIGVAVATLLGALVSFPVAFASHKLWRSRVTPRRPVWFAFLSTVAFGPVALALTPPLVAHRVSHNDRIAAERFQSLKSAVEQTRAESNDPEHICDGQALKRHYSGPPFSDLDWQYITGNYVKQDGYVFGIFCHDDARPKRGKADGTLHFCTDVSGQIGCG